MMDAAQDRYTAHWLEHVRVLAEEIGSRGSTTEEERHGAEYCQKCWPAWT